MPIFFAGVLIKYKWLLPTLLVSVITFSSPASAHAQFTLPSQQEIAARQAINDVRDGRPGSLIAVSKIKKEQSDEALNYFADARFDPNVKVRDAAQMVAGDSYESLFFLLPMVQDADHQISINVASKITILSRSQTQLQKLNASEVVHLVKNANKNNAQLVRRSPEILLLLSLFKQNDEAHRLVNQLIKANKWDVSTAANTSVVWENELVTALIARQEMETITSAQVIKVLSANPKARRDFLANINLLTDETLQRDAISLLYDTTVRSIGGEDVEGHQVYDDAMLYFSVATGGQIKIITENGVKKYDPKDVERIYKYFGLKM